MSIPGNEEEQGTEDMRAVVHATLVSALQTLGLDSFLRPHTGQPRHARFRSRNALLDNVIIIIIFLVEAPVVVSKTTVTRAKSEDTFVCFFEQIGSVTGIFLFLFSS